jgi:hypothetical protein
MLVANASRVIFSRSFPVEFVAACCFKLLSQFCLRYPLEVYQCNRLHNWQLTGYRYPTAQPVGAAAFSGGNPFIVLAPFLTAVISARIDTAISGGVLLPIGRPTGPCSLSPSVCDKSKCCISRLRRRWLLMFDPSAPT